MSCIFGLVSCCNIKTGMSIFFPARLKVQIIWLFKCFISEQSKCLVILKLLVLRHLKQGNIFQFCPKVTLKYLQIFHLCEAYTIIAPFSGKSIFKGKKRDSEVANFAVEATCRLSSLRCFFIIRQLTRVKGARALLRLMHVNGWHCRGSWHYLSDTLCATGTLHCYYSLSCHCGLTSTYWSWL